MRSVQRWVSHTGNRYCHLRLYLISFPIQFTLNRILTNYLLGLPSEDIARKIFIWFPPSLKLMPHDSHVIGRYI
jgi:hypothetical protein